MNIARFDKGNINLDASITEDGYIKANAIVTRSGVFIYRNPDGTIRRELRHPDDVSNLDSLETMKMIPITNDHPPERLVNAKNSKKLAIGYTGERIVVDGENVIANILITDEEGVKAVIEQGRKELSLGYTVDLLEEKGVFNNEPYDFIQKNIKYNHLSIVDKARAGSQARIALDSCDAEEIEKTKEDVMTDKKQKRLKIKNDEFMVEPEVFEDVSDLRDEVERLKQERIELERRVKTLSDELEATRAERDSLKEEKTMEDSAKAKMDADDSIRRAVKNRIALEKNAAIFLDKKTLDSLDSLSDLDVKKAIVKSKFPNKNLDSESEIYINGRYDSVVESAANFGRKVDSFAEMASKADSVGSKSVDDAYMDLTNRTLNAHKNYKK